MALKLLWHHTFRELHFMLSMRKVSDVDPHLGFHYLSSYNGDDVIVLPHHLICISVRPLWELGQ